MIKTKNRRYLRQCIEAMSAGNRTKAIQVRMNPEAKVAFDTAVEGIASGSPDALLGLAQAAGKALTGDLMIKAEIAAMKARGKVAKIAKVLGLEIPPLEHIVVDPMPSYDEMLSYDEKYPSYPSYEESSYQEGAYVGGQETTFDQTAAGTSYDDASLYTQTDQQSLYEGAKESYTGSSYDEKSYMEPSYPERI